MVGGGGVRRGGETRPRARAVEGVCEALALREKHNPCLTDDGELRRGRDKDATLTFPETQNIGSPA